MARRNIFGAGITFPSAAGGSTGLRDGFFRGFLGAFFAGLDALPAGFFASFLATSFAISLANFFTSFFLAAIETRHLTGFSAAGNEEFPSFQVECR
jgi:hypothetical protein